jgi:hypothetical protein
VAESLPAVVEEVGAGSIGAVEDNRFRQTTAAPAVTGDGGSGLPGNFP